MKTSRSTRHDQPGLFDAAPDRAPIPAERPPSAGEPTPRLILDPDLVKLIGYEDRPEVVFRRSPFFGDSYACSSDGRILSLPREGHRGQSLGGHFLKAHPNNKGYLLAQLHKDGKAKTYPVHLLIALAFHSEPPGPRGRGAGCWTVHHEDRVKANNAASNLTWELGGQNTRLAIQGSLHPKAILDEEKVRDIRRRVVIDPGLTHAALAEEYGCGRSAITQALTGKNWGHVPFPN